MIKELFTICILMAGVNFGSAQKVDTLYYDKDFKSVEIKEFASYVRFAYYPKDINAKKLSRTYYITGELLAECGFISIDKNDESKCIFDGEAINYYKNGKTKMLCFYRNGAVEGTQINYYENGNKQSEANFKDNIPNGKLTTYKENGNIDFSCDMINGKPNGIYTKFFDDGISCIQVEMKDGEPVTPYLTYSRKDGPTFKVKTSDNTLYLETPDINQKKTFSKDGVNWEYYSANGILIAVSPIIQRDYGKYLTLNIVFTNDSPDPILISPELVFAFNTYKGKKERLKTLTSDDYSRKVDRNQQWSSFFNALGENMAASNAGYSASSSNSNTAYVNNTYATGVGSVIGTEGTAIGAYESNTTNVGVVNSNTNTVSYNGAAAYQANMIANQRINNYNAALNQERQVKEEGYLKQNTINPGETISGYVNIKYEKSDQVEVYIDLNTIKYPFIWTIDN